jgi:hypothetical protein
MMLLTRGCGEDKMRNLRRTLVPVVAILMLAALSVCSLLAQDSDATHYVVTNDDIYRAPNAASVFKLSGAVLKRSKSLATGGWGLGGGYFATALQAMAAVGTNMCVFVADPGSDDIAAFNSTTKVGNYSDPTGSGAWNGTSLAAHGTALYAAYSASVNIGVWTINPDCSLTLANSAMNTPTFYPVNDIAVSPDGKTLVASYAQQKVDSFAISGANLTEKGPYNTFGYTAGIDITKDSKYAIIGDFSAALTQVEVLPIHSNSSLGSSDYYNVAQGGKDSNNVWLSPDETLLYVSNNVSLQITTLKFKESASAGKRLTFDCITTLHDPGNFMFNPSGLATEAPTGTGVYLYVAEWGNPSAVGLLKVPKGGCPTEVSGSPFRNPTAPSDFPATLSAYPPRPF